MSLRERAATRVGKLLLGVLVVGWVWLPGVPFSVLGDANLALSNALVAASIVLLTGWVGQISLAHASFVGIGAFVTGLLVRGWGIPFPLTLPIAGGIAAVAAAALGLVALRVRGLYLAVATLIFAWMTDAYLFGQPWFSGAGGASTIPGRPLGQEGSFPFLDFTDRRTFYYVVLAATAVALVAASNLRTSRTGRAWFALRGSEVAAASLGINVTRYKLLAFATSGFMAGVAGNLMITHTLNVTPASFTFLVSLFYLSMAVVGGLTSLGGALAAGALFAALQEAFFRVTALQGLLDVASAVLLAAVLLFFPGGLAGIPSKLASLARPVARGLDGVAGLVRSRGRPREGRVRLEGVRRRWNEVDRWAEHTMRSAGLRLVRFVPGRSARGANGNGIGKDRAERHVAPDALEAVLARLAPEPVADIRSERPQEPRLEYVPGTSGPVELPPRDEREVVLAARGVTVRFGGLTAVDDASLEVRKGEIVGLIGPNGAGKTTLFNAISGLNQPAAGTIELSGRDITPLAVHERAALGVGRTFQVIQLFPQLTVFDNLLVATHTRNPSGFLSHVAATERAIERETAARERVREVVGMLGLGDVAERRVSGLAFGRLRQVEMARALVTGAPFLMLDEPASGLDNRETDRFMDLLFFVRQRLGISMLLIEHDVRMVTGISDHLYVLDAGRMISEGSPDAVQRDPAVLAAYLGDVAPPERRPAEVPA